MPFILAHAGDLVMITEHEEDLVVFLNNVESNLTENGLTITKKR